MSGSTLSDPIATSLSVDLSSGLLEDVLKVRPRGRRSSGHCNDGISRRTSRRCKD